MNNIYTEFVDNLGRAISLSESSEHLVSSVLPVVDDNKLILRALEGVHKSVLLSIETILKFEHMFKRINLANSKEANLKLFFEKCASNYGMDEADKLVIKEILSMGKKHKESGFEFSRYRKVVIMQDSGRVSEIGAENIKNYAKTSSKMAKNSLNKLYKAF